MLLKRFDFIFVSSLLTFYKLKKLVSRIITVEGMNSYKPVSMHMRKPPSNLLLDRSIFSELSSSRLLCEKDQMLWIVRKIGNIANF